uniref:Uncharacterized protein n=1 Tax=Timema monikensis TaxID=170555 RepID=A0A7R9EB59_9NEOP|nr:unnamed protein product [Timema monikensis]
MSLSHEDMRCPQHLADERQASDVGTLTSSCIATTEKSHPSLRIVVTAGSYSDRKDDIHNINIAGVFLHDPEELNLDVFIRPPRANDSFTVVSRRKNNSANFNVREEPPVQRSRARKLLTVSSLDIRSNLTKELKLDYLVRSKLKTKFKSYSSFHISVKENYFTMINNGDIWRSGCLISPHYGKLLLEQIICEEFPCVSAPAKAAVASYFGSQEDSIRTPLVTMYGGLEAESVMDGSFGYYKMSGSTTTFDSGGMLCCLMYSSTQACNNSDINEYRFISRRLFDNGRERYHKLRQCLGGYIVLQIGLTSFRFCRQGNAYVSTTYNFHVFPRSFFSLDNSFSCQASSLEFLSRHNFDFNKFVYEGLPYLSQSQESQLRQELCEGHLFQDLERTVTLDDERVLQEECSRVCDWLASAVLGDSILLGGENLQRRGKSLVYMLHKELRKRFLSVWTFPEKGLVLVKKVSADERNDFVDLERESSSLEHDVIKSMLGFSRVFKLLTELGKPLVGHNLLLDLALMYAQFHEPLPCMYESQEDDDKTQSEENDDEFWDMSTVDEEEGLDEQVPDSAPSPDEEAIVKRLRNRGVVRSESILCKVFVFVQVKYTDFKKKITSLFPTIYDTKFLSFELRKELSRTDKWVSNVLNEMYMYFKNSNGISLALYSPSIKSTNGYNCNGRWLCSEGTATEVIEHLVTDSEGTFHEAGWDSYCTGYCFIRMAHIFASRFYGRNAEPRPLSSTEHLAAVSKMKNSINIVRANISHICLDGPDPKSSRPRLLHIRAKGSKVIDLSEISLQFEDRLYGLVVIGSGYGPRGPGFDSRHVQIIWEANTPLAREAVLQILEMEDIEEVVDANIEELSNEELQELAQNPSPESDTHLLQRAWLLHFTAFKEDFRCWPMKILM